MNTQFMKQNMFILFLIAIFLTPSMAFADAEDFDEVTYVFRSFESEVPADLQECVDIGIPYVPDFASNYDLYSLHSKKTNGRVLNENIKRIGHVLTCGDSSGLTWENRFDPFPVYFKVTVDGMELIAQGQGRFLSFDVPEAFLGMATNALEIIEGPPEIIGGFLVTNTISNVFGIPGYANGSFASIRLFIPAANNND
jgi:hypothetical protein